MTDIESILYALLGLLIIVIGFRMYSYFHKNIDSINNEPGKLYAVAVVVIVTGISVLVMSVILLFLNA